MADDQAQAPQPPPMWQGPPQGGPPPIPPQGGWQPQGPPGAWGPPGQGGYALQPHRGSTVLVLGIIGVVACLVCGIIAWAMGASDLKAMREGRMDRSGESNTRAGMICGIVSVCLHVVGFVVWLLFMSAVFRVVDHMPHVPRGT